MVFVPSEEFHSYEDVTITVEGVQILTYTWNSWSLSREGSLACHTVTRDVRLDGHLRGPVTFTPIIVRLTVEMSLHVLKTT